MRQTLGVVFCVSALASAGAQESVTVRGVAWDSLRNAPLAGAFIAVAGSSRSATTDTRGRFRIDSLTPGTYTIGMQHDVLDSIGFSGRSVRVAVGATTQSVTLAVPSFATLWRGLCGGSPPKDSGVVYGYVRDLAGKPLSGASVGVSWQHVTYARRQGIDWKDVGGQTVADSTGRYAFCGVPIDVALHLASASGAIKSAVVDLAPLTLRVARRDFSLAPDSADIGAMGTVIGTVAGEGGIAVPGAIVSVVGAPEVRSDDSGRFVLRDVPAGTRQLEARAIGAAPVVVVVDVTPRDTTTVTLSMGRVQTLEEVKVTAQTFRQIQLRDMLERRQSGLGYFRDSLVFQNQLTPASTYDGIASLQVRRLRGNLFKFVNTRSACDNMAVWLDKVHVDEGVLSSVRPDEIAAYEVYLSMSNTPPQFYSRGTCGAVVVWTKRFLRG